MDVNPESQAKLFLVRSSKGHPILITPALFLFLAHGATEDQRFASAEALVQLLYLQNDAGFLSDEDLKELLVIRSALISYEREYAYQAKQKAKA